MGEIDNRGGDGSSQSLYAEGVHSAGGESFGTAERRVGDEGGDHAGSHGDIDAGGWEQREIDRTAERVADCGITGESGEDTRVLGGVAVGDR